jgi:hypothetical protein
MKRIAISSNNQQRSLGVGLGIGVNVLVGAGGMVSVGVFCGTGAGALSEHPPGRHQHANEIIASAINKGRNLCRLLIGISSLVWNNRYLLIIYTTTQLSVQ